MMRKGKQRLTAALAAALLAFALPGCAQGDAPAGSSVAEPAAEPSPSAAEEPAGGRTEALRPPDVDYYELALGGEREGCRWQYTETEDGLLQLNLTFDGGETLVPVPAPPRPNSQVEPVPEGERFFVSRTAAAVLDGGYAKSPGGPAGPLVILTSFDQGGSWNRAELPAPEGAGWQTQYVGFTTPQDGWLVLGGAPDAGRQEHRVYLTRDGGTTWTETGNAAAKCDAPLAGANFRDAETGFLTFRGGEPGPVICRTGDGGKSWERCAVSVDEGLRPYRSAEPGVPYFDGENGVLPLTLALETEGARECELYTTDGGRSWFTRSYLPALDDALTARGVRSARLVWDGPGEWLEYSGREHRQGLLRAARLLAGCEPLARYDSLDAALPGGAPGPGLAVGLSLADGGEVELKCFGDDPAVLVYTRDGWTGVYEVDGGEVRAARGMLAASLPDLPGLSLRDPAVREKLYATGFTDEMIDYYGTNSVEYLLDVTPELFQSQFLPEYEREQERRRERERQALALPKAQDAYTGGDGAHSIGIAPLDYEYAGDGHEPFYLVGYDNRTGESWLLDEVFYGNFVHNPADDILLNNELSSLTAYDLGTGREAAVQLAFGWGAVNARGEPEFLTVGAAYDAAEGRYLVFYRENTYGEWSDAEALRLAVFDRAGAQVRDLDTGVELPAYQKNYPVTVENVSFPGGGRAAFEAGGAYYEVPYGS